MQRYGWDGLSEGARSAVETHTGPVVTAESVGEGRNSGIAAVLHSGHGTTFVKGVPLGHRQVWTQDREAAIAPHVAEVAPRMLWRVQCAGWDLIGWEHVRGRPADYAPGAADADATADVLAVPAKIPCPEVEVNTVERWRDYVDHPGDLALLDGPALAHTDLNPGNVLIADDARALLVDWAWPTRAAAWIDAACWTVRLIAAGHCPAAAEQHAARIPAWAQADASALAVFAQAQARVWEEAAARWRDHRADRRRLRLV